MVEPRKFIEQQIKSIKETIGDGKAVIALSGGVDSSVCAVLMHRAIGDKLTAAFIDDGLMRAGEPAQVTSLFRKRGINVRLVEAQGEFFSAMKGLTDPEEKRKAFRNTFYSVLGRVVKEENANWMVQGTIAADIIETKGGVKTQHNILEQIGIDPQTYGLRILEPVKELYKHEVRAVARALKLPASVSERKPFPGPGLSVRVQGEVTPERVEIVRRATKIVEDGMKNVKSFQNLAILLSDKATGVKDGKRLFGNIIVIRSVMSKDAMTARATNVPWNTLKKLESMILKEIPEVTHVVYSLTDKPPATIEFQ